MSTQCDPAAARDDGPPLNSLAEIHDADRRLQQAYRAGEIAQEELKRRRGLVYAAVTPTGAVEGQRPPGRVAGAVRQGRAVALVPPAAGHRGLRRRDHGGRAGGDDPQQPGRHQGHPGVSLGLGQGAAQGPAGPALTCSLPAVQGRLSGRPDQAVFQASAERAATRSMRRPLAATRIGIGRSGGGFNTTSRTW
jgi:hypothetical protein